MTPECDRCRYAGNSLDTRITETTIYCQKAAGIVFRHTKGTCKFGEPIDVSLCGDVP